MNAKQAMTLSIGALIGALLALAQGCGDDEFPVIYANEGDGDCSLEGVTVLYTEATFSRAYDYTTGFDVVYEDPGPCTMLAPEGVHLIDPSEQCYEYSISTLCGEYGEWIATSTCPNTAHSLVVKRRPTGQWQGEYNLDVGDYECIYDVTLEPLTEGASGPYPASTANTSSLRGGAGGEAQRELASPFVYEAPAGERLTRAEEDADISWPLDLNRMRRS